MNAGVLEDSPEAIADFIHHTTTLDWGSLRQYLQDRHDVLDCLIQLHNYENMFLPDALRKFFSLIPAPNERGQFLESLLERFSNKYIQCNRHLTMDKGKEERREGVDPILFKDRSNDLGGGGVLHSRLYSSIYQTIL